MLLLQPFGISSGRYYRILFFIHLRRFWWLYALPAALFLSMLLWLADVRFLFLLLIYGFIVVPMALTFALISCGLHPVGRYSIIKKRAEVSASGLRLCFLDDDGEEVSSATLSWQDVQRIIPTAHELVLSLGNSRLVVIPYEAFESQEQLKEFMNYARMQ